MILRLLFDTSTFILIWLVQLIIYPSFVYYSEIRFLEWHKNYQRALPPIVAPLLAGQGISIAFQFFTNITWFTFITAVIITVTIVYTFSYFIPLHLSLQRNYSIEKLNALIKNNWYRTILGTCLLLWDLTCIYFGWI